MSDRQIFIGYLCHVADDTLRHYCEKYGAIADILINREKEDNLYHCFAFVTFQSSRVVTEFMAKRPHQIHDEEIFVKRALPRAAATIPERLVVTNRLVISNPTKFKQRKLKRYFRRFGEIRKFDYQNGFIDYDDYDPVDCVLLGRPHFIQDDEVFVTKIIPSESDVQRLAQNKRTDSESNDFLESLMKRTKEEENFKLKYEYLEKQFEQYKTSKEKELSALRAELERTREELFDITQVKLDKLLKNQQLFHEQLWFNLFPTSNISHAQMCQEFLDANTNKKRKTLRES